MEKNKKLKYFIAVILVLLWAAIYYAGHGEYMSSFLKGSITPIIRTQIQKDVQIQDIYLNVLPLSLDVRGVVISEQKERTLLNADRIKIYIGLLGLLKKKYHIKRVLISGAKLDLTRQDVFALDHLRNQAVSGTAPNDIMVDLIDIVRSSVAYQGKTFILAMEDIRLSATLNFKPDINFRIRDVQYSTKGFEFSKIGLSGSVEIEGNTARVKSLVASAEHSSVKGKGDYNWKKKELVSDIEAVLDVEEMSKLARIGTVKGGKVSGRGKVSFKEHVLFSDLKISGDFFLESLMSFLSLEKVPVRGLTSFSGNVKINGSQVEAKADAKLKNGHFFGLDVDSGAVNVAYDGEYLSFTKGKAKAYGGLADVNVGLKMPTVSEYSVDINAHKIAAGPILDLIGLKLPVPAGVVSGSMRTSGKSFNPEGSFIASFTPVEGDVLKRITSASGEYRTIDHKVILNNMKVSTGVSSTEFDGEYDISEERMSFYGTINTGNIDDIVSPYSYNLRGFGFGSFLIEGTLDSPEVSGIVSLEDSGYKSYIFKKIRSSFVYSGNKVEIRNMLLINQQETHGINGSIDIGKAMEARNVSETRIRLKADIVDMSLSKLLGVFQMKDISVEGLVSGTAEISGALNDLSGSGRMMVRDPSIMNYGADTAETIIEFSRGEFRFIDLTVSKGNSVIQMDASVNMDGYYRVASKIVKLYPSDLPYMEKIEKGLIEAQMEGEGLIEAPAFEGIVRLMDFEAGKVPMGYGEARVELRGGKVSVDGHLFDGKCAFNGSLDLYTNYEWEIEAAFGKGIYDFLPAYFLREIPEDLLMSIDGKMKFSGNMDTIAGSVRLNQMNIGMYGFNFSNEGEIDISVLDNKIVIDKLRLRSGNTSFGVEGYLIPFQNIDIRIYGESSLSPLQTMFKSVESIKGNGEIVFSISGKWDNPVINGGITVSNGSIGIKDFPYRIYDITSYIYIDSNMIVIDSMKGKIGGGDISLRGSAYIQKMKLHKLYLDAALKDVTFKFMKGFAVNLDGNVIYRGDGEKYSLVGQVNIIQARYTRRVDWKTQLLKTKIGEKPRGAINPFLETELNVKISGDKDILVDNNIAKTSLRVDLLLKGTIANPTIFGRIETDSGDVYFRNNEFEIVHASADFIDPDKVNPYFDITANTAVKGYHIRIAIEGQFNHFDLSLVSDPPLDETDILSLLTVGEVGGKLKKGIEGGIGTAEATSFLTGEYQDMIEERLTSITGFDRFQIEPYLEENTGELGPRVTISKRLISDRLFLTYSSSIGSDQEDIVKIEYQVDRNVALVGIRDEKGSIGGDIKFRFEFK